MIRAKITIVALSALCPSLATWVIGAFVLVEEAAGCALFTCIFQAVPHSSIVDYTELAIAGAAVSISTISIVSIFWLAWHAQRSVASLTVAQPERLILEHGKMVEN